MPIVVISLFIIAVLFHVGFMFWPVVFWIGMMGLFCLGGIVMTVLLILDSRRPDREEQKPWEGRSPWL